MLVCMSTACCIIEHSTYYSDPGYFELLNNFAAGVLCVVFYGYLIVFSMALSGIFL